MSIPLVIEDSLRRPELFHWRGPIAREELAHWLTQRGLSALPADLAEVWRQTGGGDLFESETILAPFGAHDADDAVEEVNHDLQSGGLEPNLLVFHTGYIISAVDTSSATFVELNPTTLMAKRWFTTFDEWYAATVRAELGPRYGIK